LLSWLSSVRDSWQIKNLRKTLRAATGFLKSL